MLRYPITPGVSYINAWPLPRQSPTLTIKIIDFPEPAGPRCQLRGIQQHNPGGLFQATRELIDRSRSALHEDRHFVG